MGCDLLQKYFGKFEGNVLSLHSDTGLVAEWLGSGLQNRVQRFESARDLNTTSSDNCRQTVIVFLYDY